ncbi:MAG: homoserine kinase [Armatimonadota bacterium]
MASDEFVTVQAPATTANLGPGYDCLGIALGLYNTVTLKMADRPLVEIEGIGADELPKDETNLIYQSVQALADRVGMPGAWHIRQHNSIPLASGMGSSSAAIVAGLKVAEAALDISLPDDEMLEMAVELEGHPDNVAPALLGGFTVCYEKADGGHGVVGLEVPDRLQAVVVTPDFTVDTQAARKVLPDELPHEDAVYNVCQSSALVAMLVSRQYDDLAAAMRDRLHQPYRAQLVPGMEEIIAVAVEAGAHGAALSGSGPSILALADEYATSAVETAMLEAADESTGAVWEGRILTLDNAGAKVC